MAKTIKIAIQGVTGSYSWEAALKLASRKKLTEVDFSFCSSFKKALTMINNRTADYAVLPYRNTIIGKIEPVFSSLKKYSVLARLKLPINHCLAIFSVPEKSSIKDIKVVISHPKALAQCDKFFVQHPWLKAKEFEDTAAAAEKVFQDQNPQLAAICSEAAAKLYRLKILKRKIQDVKENFTYFTLIKKSNSTALNC